MTTTTKHCFRSPQRKRLAVDCSTPKMTDQSSKKQCDINNIIAQYAKTGTFTHLAQSVAKYQDNTQAIPLEQAYSMLSEAKELFYQLPAAVRKLMDNDPTQLNDFVSDPTNADVLLKYGLLKLKTPPKTDEGGKPPSPAPARAKTQEVKKEEAKADS